MEKNFIEAVVLLVSKGVICNITKRNVVLLTLGVGYNKHTHSVYPPNTSSGAKWHKLERGDIIRYKMRRTGNSSLMEIEPESIEIKINNDWY